MTKNANRQLQARDADGLTLTMRRALQSLALTDDWRDACVEARVSPNSVKHWLSTNEEFRAAYNDLLGPAVAVVRDMVETLGIKAAGMYDEALDALRTVERNVCCPKCNHEFTLPESGPDWNARLRAGDTVLKTSRILKDVKVTEGTITHLSMEEALALASAQYAIRHGHEPTIPPRMMEKLRPYLQKEVPNASRSGSIVDARVTRVRPDD